MMELMLDTANLAQLEFGLDHYPVAGITSNPSILKKEGEIPLWDHLKKIKHLAAGRSLHVQVVSGSADGIVAEAEEICARLGRECYVKIPVTEEGIKATRILSAQGFHITATAVYSAMQGILAVLAGAEYVAVYYNRMENNDTDPCGVISAVSDFIARSGSSARVLGASYKNVQQVVNSFLSGAAAVTVPLEILQAALSMASITQATDGFAADFWAVHGKGATMLTL